MRTYILIDGKPFPEDDPLIWGRWFENADRVVAQTQRGNILVSTVFLGLDHNFEGGPPLLFETMVFHLPSYHDHACRRYATLEEARARSNGHRDLWHPTRRIGGTVNLIGLLVVYTVLAFLLSLYAALTVGQLRTARHENKVVRQLYEMAVRDALALLREHEWRPTNDDAEYPNCPSCLQLSIHGHSADCPYGNTLTRLTILLTLYHGGVDYAYETAGKEKPQARS